MLTKEQAKAITDQVLSLAKADETHVTVDGGATTHLRFARNTPTTSGTFEELELTVRSTFGRRIGAASVNQLDRKSLENAVRRAEELARLAPEDPEHVPGLGPQSYPAVSAYFADAAEERGIEAMATGVAGSLAEAREAGVVAAGFTRADARFTCIANSRGLFGYHQYTSAYIGETARTDNGTGSGWAQSASRRMAAVDYGRVSRTAIAKAKASVGPRSLAPGSYVTILEPACVANMLMLFAGDMDMRRANEGRSYFATPDGGSRVGQKLFSEQVTLRSDPSDASIPGAPWGSSMSWGNSGNDWLPQAPRTWIERGVLTALPRDRYWAQKTGAEPVPRPSNLMLTGGTGSVDDLVASTERGILITSFWYVRGVDPQTMLYTGLTRDGVFWIENGKIAYPVNNFRWNDSPVQMLKSIVAMSASEPMPPRGGTGAPTFLVPAVKLSGFQLTSVSEAV